MATGMKLNDLHRIEYTADDGESSFRIVDFVDGKWELYERNYVGTEWFPLGCPPEWCYGQIRTALVPVAELLGVELTDEIVSTNNPQSLLEQNCALLDKRFVKVGATYHPNLRTELPRVRFARTYQLGDGRLVHLLSEENWGLASETYPDESALA